MPVVSGETYLTDGRLLFRVVSRFDPRSENAVALLEDCDTLSVDPYSANELYAMELRPIN